jgi:hypothetical protein
MCCWRRAVSPSARRGEPETGTLWNRREELETKRSRGDTAAMTGVNGWVVGLD